MLFTINCIVGNARTQRCPNLVLSSEWYATDGIFCLQFRECFRNEFSLEDDSEMYTVVYFILFYFIFERTAVYILTVNNQMLLYVIM